MLPNRLLRFRSEPSEDASFRGISPRIRGVISLVLLKTRGDSAKTTRDRVGWRRT